MLVKDVMNSDLFVLHEEETILYASGFMKKERIRNLPVVSKYNRLVGLITLREIIETVFKNPDKILVGDAMIKVISTVTPETSLKEAIEVMLTNKYGALPVIDKEHNLIGMVTEADLLKTLYKFAILPDNLLKIQK